MKRIKKHKVKVTVQHFWSSKQWKVSANTLKAAKEKINRKFKKSISKTKVDLKTKNIPRYHKIKNNTYLARI